MLAAIKDEAFRCFVTAMTLEECRTGEIARVTAADVDHLKEAAEKATRNPPAAGDAHSGRPQRAHPGRRYR